MFTELDRLSTTVGVHVWVKTLYYWVMMIFVVNSGLLVFLRWSWGPGDDKSEFVFLGNTDYHQMDNSHKMIITVVGRG